MNRHFFLSNLQQAYSNHIFLRQKPDQHTNCENSKVFSQWPDRKSRRTRCLEIEIYYYTSSSEMMPHHAGFLAGIRRCTPLRPYECCVQYNCTRKYQYRNIFLFSSKQQISSRNHTPPPALRAASLLYGLCMCVSELNLTLEIRGGWHASPRRRAFVSCAAALRMAAGHDRTDEKGSDGAFLPGRAAFSAASLTGRLGAGASDSDEWRLSESRRTDFASSRILCSFCNQHLLHWYQHSRSSGWPSVIANCKCKNVLPASPRTFYHYPNSLAT